MGDPRSDGRDAAGSGRQKSRSRRTRMVEIHYGHLAPSYVVDQVRKFAPRYGVGEETNVRRLSK